MCSISKNKKVQKGKENLQNLTKSSMYFGYIPFIFYLNPIVCFVFSFIFHRLGIIVPIFCGQLAEPGDSNSLIAAPPPPNIHSKLEKVCQL